MHETDRDEVRKSVRGYLFAAAAFFSWGFQPLYWKQLASVPALEVLAHRVVWSFLFVGILFFLLKPDKINSALKNKRTLLLLAGTSVLIALNWFLYIYAVVSDQIIQASLGYYINPLMNVLLGGIFLKERLKGLQKVALVISIAGVLYFALDYGRFPWLSLSIATAFGSYGLLKKLTPLNSLSSLMLETSMLVPVALGFILFKGTQGTGAIFMTGFSISFFLIIGGIVTSLPLYLFGRSTQLIPLGTVGFFQYIAPSIMLLIGVFFYREPFTFTHAVTFGCIWTALALYTVTLVQYVRNNGWQEHKNEDF